MPHIKRKSNETIDKRLVMAITITRQVCECVRTEGASSIDMCECGCVKKKTKVTRRLALFSECTQT